jgi:hypothetical protein
MLDITSMADSAPRYRPGGPRPAFRARRPRLADRPADAAAPFMTAQSTDHPEAMAAALEASEGFRQSRSF